MISCCVLCQTAVLLWSFKGVKDVSFCHGIPESSERPSLVKASGKMPDGRAYESHILNLPFYLIEKLDYANADFFARVE